MYCSKCGTENENGSRFCSKCGSPLEVFEAKAQFTAEPSQDNNSKEVTYWENNAQVLNNMAQQNPSQFYTQPGNFNMQQPPKKKSKAPLFIGIGSVAVILIVVMIFVFVNKSRSGVLNNILGAVQGTLDADSLEFIATTEYDGEYGSDSSSVKGILEYDLDKGKLAFDITTDGSRGILYKGTMYEVEDDEIWDSYDYSSQLNMFFDYYKDYKGALKGISDIDWEDAIDEAGLSSFIDSDKLDKCIKELEKNLNDKKYWESVCKDFSVDNISGGTKYTFDIDFPKLVASLADTFSPVIGQDMDSIMGEIENETDIFENLVVEITIKDDKLTNLKVDVEMDGESNSFELKVSDYGKAKIDKNEIEDLISDYE